MVPGLGWRVGREALGENSAFQVWNVGGRVVNSEMTQCNNFHMYDRELH